MNQTAQVDFAPLRERARKAIAPLKSADGNTNAKSDFSYSWKRAIGASELPPPYLIYFLLVDLLGFRDLGRFEKLAWSIPIDFEGKAFLIEHRKFGVGIFVQDDGDTLIAKQIPILLSSGVKSAASYFKWKADVAVATSKFNVVNNAIDLLGRYLYLASMHKNKVAEAAKRKDEVIETKHEFGSSYKWPSSELIRESSWLAISAIESFFAWTEHLFVLFAILKGEIQNGKKFSEISGADWSVKFKSAVNVSNRDLKLHYDSLTKLRREVRNFVAHGTFGKGGEALHFHSSAGAVPVLQDITNRKARYSLREGKFFDEGQAFRTIEDFIAALKIGSSEPAWLYVQEFGLPLIMTMAQDGSYRNAMTSAYSMTEFAEYLSSQMDNATNMDW